MKVAIVGSRNLTIPDLEKYIPKETTEIISGGARGVDTSSKEFALSHNIKFTEILPEYEKYGRSAPLRRNLEIIKSADLVIAFWDGFSKGTEFVIENCEKENVDIKVYRK